MYWHDWCNSSYAFEVTLEYNFKWDQGQARAASNIITLCCRDWLHSVMPITKLVGNKPRQQGSWGQHRAHLGPTGPRWALCWPHELCYLGESSTDMGSPLAYWGVAFLRCHVSDHKPANDYHKERSLMLVPFRRLKIIWDPNTEKTIQLVDY